MKRLFIIGLMLCTLMFSCEREGQLGSFVSEDENFNVDQVALLVNIKTSDSTYLVVRSIDSIKIKINNNFTTIISSEVLDTSIVPKFTDGNKFVSTQKINYLITAQQEDNLPDFNTAGDYANYLNSAYQLSPGEYVCFIEFIDLTFNDNSSQRFYPLQYQPFKIEDNASSAFIGEVEVKI
ncbi:MAG: hypothetical protein MRY83_20025 [Flavobacteriales bacterium]|nr:hypothetical protein [Flavobacteriales bacterium]